MNKILTLTEDEKIKRTLRKKSCTDNPSDCISTIKIRLPLTMYLTLLHMYFHQMFLTLLHTLFLMMFLTLLNLFQMLSTLIFFLLLSTLLNLIQMLSTLIFFLLLSTLLLIQISFPHQLLIILPSTQ